MQVRPVVEELHVDLAAAFIALAVSLQAFDGMKRLMQLAYEMDEIFERVRAIRYLGVRVLDHGPGTFDRADDAVAGDLYLAIACSIKACRVKRNVDEVPAGRLGVGDAILVSEQRGGRERK